MLFASWFVCMLVGVVSRLFDSCLFLSCRFYSKVRLSKDRSSCGCFGSWFVAKRLTWPPLRMFLFVTRGFKGKPKGRPTSRAHIETLICPRSRGERPALEALPCCEHDAYWPKVRASKGEGAGGFSLTQPRGSRFMPLFPLFGLVLGSPKWEVHEIWAKLCCLEVNAACGLCIAPARPCREPPAASIWPYHEHPSHQTTWATECARRREGCLGFYLNLYNRLKPCGGPKGCFFFQVEELRRRILSVPAVAQGMGKAPD